MVDFPTTIIPPSSRLQLVDPKTGNLTTNGLQFLQQLWAQVVGTNPTVPCTASGTNDIILTPAPVPVTAKIEAYKDYMVFTFVAANTSTGTVTANVQGLGDKPVFKSNGATPAGSNDVVAGDFYFLIYNSALAGFVLK